MYVKKRIGIFELLSEHWKAVLAILMWVFVLVFPPTFSEEIKDKSGSSTLLSKQITQLAEDFDFGGVQELAQTLQME